MNTDCYVNNLSKRSYKVRMWQEKNASSPFILATCLSDIYVEKKTLNFPRTYEVCEECSVASKLCSAE